RHRKYEGDVRPSRRPSAGGGPDRSPIADTSLRIPRRRTKRLPVRGIVRGAGSYDLHAREGTVSETTDLTWRISPDHIRRAHGRMSRSHREDHRLVAENPADYADQPHETGGPGATAVS